LNLNNWPALQGDSMSSLPPFSLELNAKGLKDFHSKARRYLWESIISKKRLLSEELDLIKSITEISPEDPNFQELMKAKLMNQKIVSLAQKIMKPGEKGSKPFEKRETVILTASSSAIQKASAPILPARPPITDEARRSLLNMHRARHHSQVIEPEPDQKIVPIEERHSPPRVRRANTEVIFFEALKDYPPYIQTPRAANELVQNAICIQFLFPETFRRLFDKQDRVIFDRLADFHFISKYQGLNFQESVKKCFGDLNKGKKLRSVFSRLMRRQTISKVQGAPKIPNQFELPQLFNEYPFNTPASTEECLQILVSIQYKCIATFSTYKEDEKDALHILLQTSILRDTLHSPYQTALKIVLSQCSHVKESSFQSLLELTGCHKKIPHESASGSFNAEAELQKILALPQLSHPKAFATLMASAEETMGKVLSHRGEKIHQLLLKTAFRLQREPILFHDAMKSSFTLNSLKALFGKDDRGNLEDFNIGIQALSPKVYLPHRSVVSDESFAKLGVAAKNYPRPASKEIECVLKQFDEIDGSSKKDPSLARECLVFLYFNHLSLKELFDQKNDLENAKLLSRCIDEILKKSAS